MNHDLTAPRARDWTVRFNARRWLKRHIQYVLIPFALAFFLLMWEALVAWKDYPAFILPTPRAVLASWIENWRSGLFPRHLGITLFEIGLGFGIALMLASAIGYVLAKSPLVEKIVSPYLVAAQAIPLVAVGPLIIIWIRTGIVQNALIAALITFFPMLVNTIVGIRSVREEYRALMRSYHASAWQVFTKLELPAALPVLFGGLRVGVTLAVIGVIVVELMWSDRGLGYLMNIARGALDTPMLFATIATLSAMALTLYIGVMILERILIRWQRSS
ncbi:MAG: ABC transporter permease [Chloroflexi bacterium]|nr:ABC transporter permease [Chloroflexota bacterium]